MRWVCGFATKASDAQAAQPRSYGKPSRAIQRFGRQKLVTFALTVWILLASPSAFTANGTVKIVAFGDSLTAGYELPASAAFPAKLEATLKAKGINVEITNAGVSGDSASGSLDRLDWSIPEGTDAVIVEIGANDALRGVDPQVTRKALIAIVEKLRARRIEILLCGLLAPRNLGPSYTDAYDGIFTDLAKDTAILFYPFFLDGVALDPKFNLRDGIHPNANGIAEIVQRIMPKVEELVARVHAKRRS
ncbi:MAG: arylesterase [Rhizobiales bacterium]|nr:arylesterase [Hyphomicrobiales bacterium]